MNISFLAKALLVVLLALPLAGCQTVPSTARPQIRVLSYNIHHGEGTDGKFDLPRLASVIKNVAPDLVALQEVDDKTQRANGVDQAAELGRLTGMLSVFGKAMDYSGGGYGEAVLSRWPFIQTVNHPLPANPGREPRAALAVKIKAGHNGPVIWLVGTHLDHLADHTDRIAQAKRINELLVREGGEPVVLAGDLNAQPNSPTMGIFAPYWVDSSAANPQPTRPSDNPRVRIDYVLFRPRSAWRVVETRVLEEKIASDHRPLLVVLEWVGD